MDEYFLYRFVLCHAVGVNKLSIVQEMFNLQVTAYTHDYISTRSPENELFCNNNHIDRAILSQKRILAINMIFTLHTAKNIHKQTKALYRIALNLPIIHYIGTKTVKLLGEGLISLKSLGRLPIRRK